MCLRIRTSLFLFYSDFFQKKNTFNSEINWRLLSSKTIVLLLSSSKTAHNLTFHSPHSDRFKLKFKLKLKSTSFKRSFVCLRFDFPTKTKNFERKKKMAEISSLENQPKKSTQNNHKTINK